LLSGSCSRIVTPITGRKAGAAGGVVPNGLDASLVAISGIVLMLIGVPAAIPGVRDPVGESISIWNG
jgi:hypothetical protein